MSKHELILLALEDSAILNLMERTLLSSKYEIAVARDTESLSRIIQESIPSANGSDIDKVNARRLVTSKLGDNQVIKRLFDEIAPRFATRPGGYTRVLKLGPRMGDAAEMVILELVEE